MKTKNAVIVFLVIVVIAGFYFWSTKPVAIVSETSTTPIPATSNSDWKTYTNIDDGFSISYPKNLKPISQTYSTGNGIMGYNITFKSSDNEDLGKINLKVQNSNPQDFEAEKRNLLICKFGGVCTNDLVGGVESMTTTIFDIEVTSFAKNNILFQLSFPATSDYEEVGSKMLASFKFTK